MKAHRGSAGAGKTPAVASLGMYPFDHLRDDWDRLWERIRTGVDEAPDALAWDRELVDVWTDPALLIGVTCGWPLVTQLADTVAVVGTFDPLVSWAAAGNRRAGTYRSVFVASKPLSFDEWRRQPAAIVAVNGTNSLSGWVSLCDGWGGVPDDVVVTGTHADSLRAVARGDAHVASIDAVSFEILVQHEPMSAGAVHVVGHGPAVPALPIVTSGDNADRVPELRAAIAAAVTDPGLGRVCRALRIGGFVPFDRVDYEPLLRLAPSSAG